MVFALWAWWGTAGPLRAQQAPEASPPVAGESEVELPGAGAQESRRSATLGAVLVAWVEGFDLGTLRAGTEVDVGPKGHKTYRLLFLDGGGGIPGGPGRITHESALFRLLADADRERGPRLSRGLLALAAAGVARGPADLAARRIRTVARGRLLERFRGGDRAWIRQVVEGVVPVPLPQQCAAVLVLGAAGGQASADWLEDAARLSRLLLQEDPRLRLAAAEALGQVPSQAVIRPVAEALHRESHPVVAQALVSALRGCMAQSGIAGNTRAVVKLACRTALGRAGWRADLALVEFLERWPDRPTVPALIGVLAGSQPGVDRYLDRVDPTASPRLAQRTHRALMSVTGALLPAEPEAWRKFWRGQGADLVVRPRPVKPPVSRTSAQFYGVPVTGRNVVFLLDASGSMDRAAVDTGGPVHPGTPRLERQRGEASRLEVAQSRVLEAVQAMDPKQGVFRVWSFADLPVLRTGEPRRPGRRVVRELSNQLAAIEPAGGTDLFRALVSVLGADRDPLQDVVHSNPEVPDELFILSDGEPSAGSVRDPAAILAMVRESNRYRRVRIHCILIGDGRGAGLMRAIAEGSGGVFVRGR